MVALAEDAMAIRGRDDRGVFERRLAAVVDRAHQDRPAARREHPVDLRQRPAVVLDVLEHVVADQEVEALGVEREVHHVELVAGQRRVEVAGHVAQAARPARGGGGTRTRARCGASRRDDRRDRSPVRGRARGRDGARASRSAGTLRASRPRCGRKREKRRLAARALDRLAAVADAADRSEQCVATRARHQPQQRPLEQRVLDLAVLGAEEPDPEAASIAGFAPSSW